jgi:RimJ/RimL family protein N-acetyltransferase
VDQVGGRGAGFSGEGESCGDQYFVVAVVGGKIVGCADIQRRKPPTARHVASLGVLVNAAYRRRGVGQALMTALLDWAKEQKLRRVELKVFVRNAGAIALDEQLGFVIEGMHRRALCKQGVWVDEYTMTLILDVEQRSWNYELYGCLDAGTVVMTTKIE